MKVKDIMLTKYISFDEDDTVDTVIQTFLSNPINSIPVIDATKKIVGMIHEQEIYRYLNPKLPENAIEFEVFFEAFKENQLSNRIDKLKKEKIKTLVEEKSYFSIEPEDNLEEAIVYFSKTEQEQIPVITKSKRLVGMLRRKELLNIVYNEK